MGLPAMRENASAPTKFTDPKRTLDGQPRATVALEAARTLWFNTGTLCNIECQHCYMHSSPTNDALVYLTRAEVADYLNQIQERNWPTAEIGFTGGEPFMNPDAIGMVELALERGYKVLVLTNAMRPMMRPRVKNGLMAIRARYRDALTLRISLDHYTGELHDLERGRGSFGISLEGMRWLSEHGFKMHVAGRTMWDEDLAVARAGYRRLFEENGFEIDADDPVACMLFPEMDELADVPEISENCWDVLGKRPSEIMCATSRMVVKRKGAKTPVVVSCTLLSEDPKFELGPRLADAERPITLNHPYCASFCFLGGACCSG